MLTTPTKTYHQDLDDAVHRLGAAFPARISMRLPCTNAIMAAPSSGEVVTLEETTDRDWALHAAVYRVRDDIGAVATFRTRWTAMLLRLNKEMPAQFDEQVRHLGSRVRKLDLQDGCIGETGMDVLRRGDCAYLLEGEALCLGFNTDRLIFNAELFDKCSKAYVLAALTGKPIGRIPFYVRYIAARRLAADRERAASAWAIGEVPRAVGSY